MDFEKPTLRTENRLFLANMEVDVVDHCNLTCRSCSHLSPIAKRQSVSAAELARDLSLLSVNIRVGRLKVVGGEPLLHPQLEEILHSIRGAKLCDRVALITNGHLLGRLTDAICALIDEIVVSSYSSAPPDSEALLEASALAARTGVSFRIDSVSSFREMFRFDQEGPDNLTSRIFETCEIAHVYRCVSVRSGHLYMCPQAHSIARVKGVDPTSDGICISSDPDFVGRLLQYLSQEVPLEACASCLGTVGRLLEHQQLGRVSWRAHLAAPASASVDYLRLESLESSGRKTAVDHGLPPRRD